MLDGVMEEIARNTPGFQGVTIMGTDGIPLAQHPSASGPDLELFAAESSALLKSLSALGSQEACGRLQGLQTGGERWRMFLERVSPEYFLLLVVDSDATPGHCRYRLRRAALDLEPELT